MNRDPLAKLQAAAEQLARRLQEFAGELEQLGSEPEETSEPAARAAGRILRDPDASPDAKTAAGSALTQRASRPKQAKPARRRRMD